MSFITYFKSVEPCTCEKWAKVSHVTREEEKKFCISQNASILLVDEADERKHNRHVQLYMSDMMHDFSLTL
jgi:carotenoid cleavage dioxygenase-like enzyme